MKPFDEAAGELLDELLRRHRIKGRHNTACVLSLELQKARDAGAAAERERWEATVKPLIAKLGAYEDGQATIQRRWSDAFAAELRALYDAYPTACQVSAEASARLYGVAARMGVKVKP
jgi:hypothetical protein